MQATICRQALRPLALAIGFAFYAPVHAQVIDVQSVSATASFSLNGGATTALSAVSSAPAVSSVDVLDFTYSAGSESGIHTYGGPSGNFGSRSSGAGYFDVTGKFSISETITNNTAIAQNASFNFYITPGLLYNDIRSNITGSQYVASGIKFDIKTNGTSVWGSQADLKTTSTGTQLLQSGTNLLTPGVVVGGGVATTYSIAGGSFNVDLGVLAAGQSITLQYDLDTYANGNAPANGIYTSPQQTITVPDQLIFVPEQRYTEYKGGGYGDGYGDGYGGDGYGGYGGGVEVVIPAYNYLLEGYEYTVGGYTFENQASITGASSGDPFDIHFTGAPAFSPYVAPGTLGQGVTFTPAVPEPEGYAMFFAGLGVVGLIARRKRSA